MISLKSTQVPRRFTLLTLVSIFATLCVLGLATRAHAATPWGELSQAQLPIGETPGTINLSKPSAFAVDPADGSFYVGHELKPGTRPEFEIQRFNAKGEAETSITFVPPEAKKASTGGAGEEIQLTVDPKRDRVYALIVYRRREANEAEEKAEENEEEKLIKEGKKCEPGTCYERFPQDSSELAAGELYAFFYKNGKLTAARTSGGETVPIANEGALNAQAEAPKEAVLNPRGLAVEPETGDLAIPADEDEQTDLNAELGASQKCRAMTQMVAVQENKSTGELTGRLGERYVDNKEAIEELGCEKEENENLPFSPVVTPGGKVFAEANRSTCPGTEVCNGGEIWELGKSSNQIGEIAGIKEYAMAPRPVYDLPESQTLLQFHPEGVVGVGGVVGPTMDFLPDSEGSREGKIYLSAEINEGHGATESDGAVLVLGYNETGSQPEVNELGWTGGGREAGGTGCLIPRPSGQTFFVGGFKEAGGKEGVVAYDAFERKNEKFAEALQFGPGGSTTGCPRVTLTPPTVTAKGVPVTRIVPGEAATFSSTLQAANAVSVEWKFENTKTDKTETVTGGYEFEAPTVTHTFNEAGTYKVTEIVHSDNLATPELDQTLEGTHELIVKVVGPEVEISSKSSYAKGEQATFEATVADENKHVNPLKYVWTFGDGTKEEGTTEASLLVAHHTYGAPCASCTVTLEVTDSEGTKGSASVTIVVHAEQEKPIVVVKPPTVEIKPPPVEVKPPGPKPTPEAKLVSTTLSVAPSGSLMLKVSCPSGESSCAGTVILKTVSAVSASTHHKKAILTLASGSFVVAGGQVKAVSLHLSAKARALLAKVHVLRASATLVAHDSSGASHTTTVIVTLRAAKPSHKKKH